MTRKVLLKLAVCALALLLGLSAAVYADLPEGDGPLTPYEEAIPLTWGVSTSAVQKFHDGDTYEDNRWSRRIKDELNIDLGVAFSADGSTDAYQQKLNLLLVSGDLPDIIRTADRQFINQAYEAGYLMDITDVYADYASDNVAKYTEGYDESFAGATFDGRLHGIPWMTDNFHEATYLWIRDDWLENTGLSAPTTLDEMVEMARKFTFEDPDGNGQDDTYGFALMNALFNGNYGGLEGILAAYGIPSLSTDGTFFRGEDGKITWSYIQPEMKEVLSLVRDMYAEGLIDPEFVVKDTSNSETDIGTGKYGMMYHRNWGTWHPYNITHESEGVITRPYPIPTQEGYDYKIGISSEQTGDIFMINAGCENPEAAIKIFNLYIETCLESDDPTDFDTYWSDEQYRLCPIFMGFSIPESFTDELFGAIDAGSDENLPSFLKQVYGYVIDFESGANTDANAYGTWGQMFSRGSMKIAKEDYDGHLVTNVMGAQRPEIWLQNASVLTTSWQTTFTDIITGNKPIEAFDDFVANWLVGGGQQTLDEMEVLYPIG